MSSPGLCLLAMIAALCVGARAAAQSSDLDDAEHVLTVKRAVQLAIEHNPGLDAAVLQLEAARLSVRSEEARYDPLFLADLTTTHTERPILLGQGTSLTIVDNTQLGVGASKRFLWGTDLALRLAGSVQQTDTLIPLMGSGAGQFGPSYGLNLRLSVTHPFLRGFGSDVGEAELAAARARRDQSEHTRVRVASELLRAVLAAYWELWYASAAVEIEAQSLALAQRQLDEAQARAETGTLAQADVWTFETNVATREESLLAARIERARRRLALRERLGMFGKEQEIGDPSEPQPPSPPGPPEDARAQALAESAVLRERESAVELARVQARTAADPLRPRLDLQAWVQADGLGNEDIGAAVEQAGTLGAVSASVGLIYEGPFTGRRRESEAARARLAVDTSEAQLAEARQAVLSELELALAQLAAGSRSIALAERTTEIAEQQLTAAQERFRTGTSTSLAVVEAENQLRAVRFRLARARTDLLLTSLTIDHLTGALLAHWGAGI